MNKTIEILEQLRATNSSNEKLKILKENKDDLILPRLLKMVYDTVAFNYYTSPKSLDMRLVGIDQPRFPCNLSHVLDQLEYNLCNRNYTGNAAREFMVDLMRRCDNSMRILIVQILDRDLRLNLGRTQINKVWKDLIVKPPYQRCSIYGEKTAKKINYPAIIQLKADGMAIFVNIQEGFVECYTRSGESFKLDSLQHLKENKDLIGYTIQGEFLIEGESERSKSNGLLNSLIKYRNGENKTLDEEQAKIIEDRIVYQVWDIISNEDMQSSSSKLGGTPYKDRWSKLNKFMGMVNEELL